MSRPRQVLPGKTYMLTRSCLERRFFLRPGEVTNATFEYCLAVAAARCDIQIVLPFANTNHHHTVLYDANARASEFMQQFHLLVARAINAHLGRSDYFWSCAEPSLVELVDADKIMEKLVYVATNAVKDGLVARVDEWPGFSGLHALLSGEPIVARRPSHFFRADGPLEETVTLTCSFPPGLGEPDELRADLRRRIAKVEAEYAAQRLEAKQRVLGAAAVKRQSPFACPTTPRRRRSFRARWAASCEDASKLQRALHRAFQAAYQRARAAWRAGDRTVVFPAGTNWLRRFAGVTVADARKI